GKSGLRARLHRCNDFRNDYIHGLWTGLGRDGSSFTKVRYKADRGLHPVKQTIGVGIPALWKAHEFIFDTALLMEHWRSAYNYREHPKRWPVSWRGMMQSESDKKT